MRDRERGRATESRKGGKEDENVDLSTKLGIKPAYTAFRHLENSSEKQGVTVGATDIPRNHPNFQQMAICYLIYESPFSTTGKGQAMGVSLVSLAFRTGTVKSQICKFIWQNCSDFT